MWVNAASARAALSGHPLKNFVLIGRHSEPGTTDLVAGT